MDPALPLIVLVIATAGTFVFSVLTYALRDFSRVKLADYLGNHNGDQYFELLTDRAAQHIIITAIFRQLTNILIWASLFVLAGSGSRGLWLSYAAPIVMALFVSTLFSVALPNSVANYAGEPIIGFTAPLIVALYRLMKPATFLIDLLDASVKRAMGVKARIEPEEFEQEIMSAVEEGESQGVVDEQERELIENVIEFRDTAAGYVMTARSEIVALSVHAGLDEVRRVFEDSGHSRVLVIDGSLDKVVGFLYARDLIKSVGVIDQAFDLRPQVRPAMFIPETTPLRHLLTEFRQAKVQVAVVLDEYGGTTGLITIEDILEELVGEIADEHEPEEPEMFRRTGEMTADVDARLAIETLNQDMHLTLPEDAGYETVGGFLSNVIGRIPGKGAVYEFQGVRFTVLDAEPQRIGRVKVDILNRINSTPPPTVPTAGQA